MALELEAVSRGPLLRCRLNECQSSGFRSTREGAAISVTEENVLGCWWDEAWLLVG